MASITQPLPVAGDGQRWFWQWLRDEMAPYPGRGSLVARMVVASTLTMILTMTYRVPFGAYGAIYAMVLSRESLAASASALRSMGLGVGLAGAYIIVGGMLTVGNPPMRFLWVLTSFFLIFYVLSAMREYDAAGRFGYLVAITTPLWDQQVPVEVKVEGTLWAVGTITVATAIALVLEFGLAAITKRNDLTDPLAEALTSVENLLRCHAEGRVVDAAAHTGITRLAMLGTSRLRRILSRGGYDPVYVVRMGAVVALVGRIVDLAASMTQFATRVSNSDCERIGRLADRIAEVRRDIKRSAIPHQVDTINGGEGPSGIPLVDEMERTVALIPEAFIDSQPLSVFAQREAASRPDTALSTRLLNPEHFKFGLRGALAATSSYIIYNALFWPDISTALATCFLTALTTIGASHQKQFLRLMGAAIGGLAISLPVQVFLLASIDSIGGFTVLFVIVAVFASWIATSSPRLSYLGVQVIIAFGLINLQEFRIQTSLMIGRDRVIGILLGLFMMSLFFDQFWGASAGTEMKKAFVANLRLLAEFARGPVSLERGLALRDAINTHFDKVRSLADGVLFEFGPSRQRDLELRSRIRRWQPQLRALFLMRIASVKYRLQFPGFELPESIRLKLREYDDHSASMVEEMADHIDRDTPPAQNSIERSHELLNAALEGVPPGESLAAVLRGIDALTASLAADIAAS
jgi:multidrug resistance protein MdtO